MGPIPTHITAYPLQGRWPMPSSADIDAIKMAARNPTNDNRTVLRRVVRNALSFMPDTWADHLKAIAGMSAAKVVDSISYGALVDIAAGATASAIDGSEVDFRLAIRRLEEAFTNDAVCHLKKRFDGPSRGYHVDCIEGEGAVILIDTAFVNAATTTPTTTTGATMTTTTTKTLDYNQAVAVIAACSDILGIDARRSVFDRLKGMVDRQGWDDNDKTPILASVHRQAEDNNLVTVDDLDDDLAALVQELTLSLKGIAHTKPAAKATPTPTIDPNLAPAVNALLNQATKGALTSIEGLIEAHAAKIAEVETLSETMEKLRAAAAAAPAPIAKSGTVTIDRGTLTYDVVMRPASDLFIGPNGTKADVLKFDLPTLVWRDDTGTIVQHPDCPPADQHYQFRLRLLVKFLTALKFGQNAWLHGHTGTGKTTFAEQVAARLGFPVERLNLDGYLERADMVGSTEIAVENGVSVTRFREGILPRAMRNPCFFILDEIDAGRPDALFVIQRALERKGLTITEDSGRVVQPHELFRFVATANSRGQGDEHGWYQGVRPMNLAMLNRFGAFIEVPYLDQDDEKRLLEGAYPALNNAEVGEMTQFATEIRTAFKSGEISQTLSPRGLHAMAEYYLHFKTLMSAELALRESIEAVVIDAAPADCEQRIRELADRVFA